MPAKGQRNGDFGHRKQHGLSDPRPQFHLSGPSVALDPRTHAVRADLADIALANVHFAPHYAQGVQRWCAAAHAPLMKAPAADAEQGSELLAGDAFWVLDITAGWAWGYCAHDHYVGYVAAKHLSTEGISAKEQPKRDDPVAVAESRLGTPYVWGGRGGAGLDCSGLAQTSFAAAGIALPRDADLQMAALADAPDAVQPYKRGDLIFMPGHVGLMTDDTHFLHATKHGMITKVEPLADVVARYEAEYGAPAILSAKRILPA
jgi:cell wall-associated NlpC family hydrolase